MASLIIAGAYTYADVHGMAGFAHYNRLDLRGRRRALPPRAGRPVAAGGRTAPPVQSLWKRFAAPLQMGHSYVASNPLSGWGSGSSVMRRIAEPVQKLQKMLVGIEFRESFIGALRN